MKEITQQRLKELMTYNQDSGEFIWIKKSHKFNTNKIGKKVGSLCVQGYLSVMIDGNRYKLHRLVFLYINGKLPLKYIDHINHNKSDNRLINLREVTSSQNSRNTKLMINNTSGTVGVELHKTGKWRARIVGNKKRIELGYFTHKEDAIKARKKAEKIYNYHYNHGMSL